MWTAFVVEGRKYGVKLGRARWGSWDVTRSSIGLTRSTWPSQSLTRSIQSEVNRFGLCPWQARYRLQVSPTVSA